MCLDLEAPGVGAPGARTDHGRQPVPMMAASWLAVCRQTAPACACLKRGAHSCRTPIIVSALLRCCVWLALQGHVWYICFCRCLSPRVPPVHDISHMCPEGRRASYSTLAT